MLPWALFCLLEEIPGRSGNPADRFCVNCEEADVTFRENDSGSTEEGAPDASVLERKVEVEPLLHRPERSRGAQTGRVLASRRMPQTQEARMDGKSLQPHTRKSSSKTGRPRARCGSVFPRSCSPTGPSALGGPQPLLDSHGAVAGAASRPSLSGAVGKAPDTESTPAHGCTDYSSLYQGLTLLFPGHGIAAESEAGPRLPPRGALVSPSSSRKRPPQSPATMCPGRRLNGNLPP